MEFVNFEKHLQDILDTIATDTFEVSNTRDMVGKTDKINVVFTALAGSVYKNSASIPYSIDIFTDNPEQVINIFTSLAKSRNGNSFISLVKEGTETKEYTVFEYYTTPAVAEKGLAFGTNIYARLTMFVNLNVLFEVGNVSAIEIDGEEIEFVNGTLSYATEVFSNRVTGQELNKARKKTATTTLNITMVNKTSIFTNKVNRIMFNLLSGRTIFAVKVKLTNGFVGELPMMLTQNAFSFAQNTPNLPSFNVILTVGDNR